MQIDSLGKKRYKVNLHMHTSVSDGDLSPAEAVQLYRNNGYDAVALTDHWFYGEGGEAEGMTILSGAEYNIGGNDGGGEGVFHILGIGMSRTPSVMKSMSAQQLIDRIHEAGGIAVLAHPAWSLNSTEQIMPLRGVDATEIYNSVSGVHQSRRADSSLIVDMLASRGRIYPLLATDDTHYYDADACFAYIMVEAEDNSREALMRAIRKGHFYATQGPEVHLTENEDGSFTATCSPCSEIVFLSNVTWSQRAFVGDGLTEATYMPRDNETFLRVQVTDAEGKMAWTNIGILKQ
ncbi:MAG: hypothetical protein IJX80_03905 [Clostridia bacterium]|nr:hypothetical protein [Clostridia bacterium]